jgi:NADH-quinone oxidoreductase subunit C
MTPPDEKDPTAPSPGENDAAASSAGDPQPVDAAAETPPSASTTSDVKPEQTEQTSVDTAKDAEPATDAVAEKPAAEGEKPAAEAAAPTAEAAAPAAEKPAAKPAAERPARPAKAEEPKEAPRNPPPPGSIADALRDVLPGVELKAYMVPELRGESVCVEVSRDDLSQLMTACRDDERLDLKYMRSLGGIDWMEEGLEVAYHLWSFNKMHALTVKTRVTYDDAVVPSVAALYPAADWHERETRDMFGIHFEGHPNLVPLLLPDDMTDHFPLRKENPLQEIEEWQGENLREGAGEGDE